MPATGQITYNGIGLSRLQPGRPVIPASYDKQARLTQATSNPLGSDPGLHSQYAYDADGIRIARRTLNKDTDALLAATVYLPGGTEITRNNLGAPTSVHHIATPGGTPLTTIRPTGQTWAFADPANTIRFTRENTGALAFFNYYPHGDPTTVGQPTTPGNRGYLNKTHDPNGDLRLDQRNYTPTLNILTTPDPLLNPSDPQNLNPYAMPVTTPSPSPTRRDSTSLAGVAPAHAADMCREPRLAVRWRRPRPRSPQNARGSSRFRPRRRSPSTSLKALRTLPRVLARVSSGAHGVWGLPISQVQRLRRDAIKRMS